MKWFWPWRRLPSPEVRECLLNTDDDRLQEQEEQAQEQDRRAEALERYAQSLREKINDSR